MTLNMDECVKATYESRMSNLTSRCSQMESTAAAVMLLLLVLSVLVGRTRRWLPYIHPKGFRGLGIYG